MGFAEALSDDGKLTGRGHPLIRGLACGLMTAVGGIGHTLPFLIPNFYTATTIAVTVVILELAAISYVRNKYMDTPLLQATFQIFVGGLLVFLALLPQFARPGGAWPMTAQLALLGGVFVTLCFAFYLSLGFGARRILTARPVAARIISRVSGVAMILVGLLLVAERVAQLAGTNPV